MTDIKELFDMVETKNEPDLDSWKQQQDRQHRTTRNRKVGAILVAATLAIAVGIFALLSLPNDDEGSTPAVGPEGQVPPVDLERDVQDVVVVGMDGTPVLGIPGIPQDAGQLDLSPNGTQIAFTESVDGGTQIAVIGIDGSGKETLTTGRPSVGAPAWSPDGDQIAFEWFRDGQFDIYVMRADGSDVRQITTDADKDVLPRWSPDGNSIAYVNFSADEETEDSQFTDSGDIWSVPASGGAPVNLTDMAGPDTSPDYSPDGGQIAYRHGDDLWLMNADGSNPELLLKGAGLAPRWSPDGTQIAFGYDDVSYRPNIEFAGDINIAGNPLLLLSVLDVKERVSSQVGNVGFIYYINSPMWWSDDQLLIHRVGH